MTSVAISLYESNESHLQQYKHMWVDNVMIIYIPIAKTFYDSVRGIHRYTQTWDINLCNPRIILASSYNPISSQQKKIRKERKQINGTKHIDDSVYEWTVAYCLYWYSTHTSYFMLYRHSLNDNGKKLASTKGAVLYQWFQKCLWERCAACSLY